MKWTLVLKLLNFDTLRGFDCREPGAQSVRIVADAKFTCVTDHMEVGRRPFHLDYAVVLGGGSYKGLDHMRWCFLRLCGKVPFQEC